jgi:heat-inducible transcriptional repressor
MLDERKSAILRAIVREYVRSGQPVGSKALAGRAGIEVSPATIRNDMAVLEELGYVGHPYTSAGRIPTDHGYRWFIDNWPGRTWPDLPSRERKTIAEMLTTEFRGLDEALEETSQVLSDVTHATAVVVAPPSRKDRLRRLELLRREDQKATILLIADTGVVEQGVVDFEEAPTEEGLSKIATQLSGELEGTAFEDIPAQLRAPRGGIGRDKDRDLIADEIDGLISRRSAERIFRGGTANILSPGKFRDLETAQDVVEALEEPLTLTKLIDAARKAGSMLIFIGTEVPVQKMQACAIVFAPYEVRSDLSGTLGVVGPTRMDYPHTISAVESVARSLSEWLGTTGV